MKEALVLTVMLMVPLAASEAPQKTWLCIGSRPDQAAVKTLAAFRAGQGMKVVFSEKQPEAAITECIPKPSYVVILGDDNWTDAGKPGQSKFPAARKPFYKWEQKQPDEFASDIAYGDLDADGIPDIPVGRLCAADPAGLQVIANKIVAWENRAPTIEDLSLPIWTGDPNYGRQYTSMVIGFLFMQVNLHAPKWARIWVVNGDPHSPFCGWPRDQSDHFQSRCQQGGIVSAMIGHGLEDHFWSMGDGEEWSGLTAREAATIKDSHPTAPRLIFACSCGQFSHPSKSCLAECLLQAPGGPVLVVAASVTSHPMTNYYTSTAMLRELMKPSATFGETFVAAQRNASARTEAEKEAMLAALEGEKLGKKLDVKMLKRDQLLMYNILGDPATSIRQPLALEATVNKSGDVWKWEVTAPRGSEKLLVEIRAPTQPPAFSQASADREAANAALAKANEKLAFKKVQEIPAGQPWKGEVKDGGTLRFVALGGGKIWAAGLEAK